jgi:hypothetical protein
MDVRNIWAVLLMAGLNGCAVSPEQASQRSDNEVCESYGVFSRSGMWGAAAETYRREIEHRKLMTTEEWALADKKTIRIGMSRCAMYASWGKPDRENRSVGSYGEHIQHVYNSGYRYIRPKYVYTRNGIVSSWQD